MRSFILMLLLIPTGIANAEDWPRFRNSNGSASNAKATVPLEWSSTKNIAWKQPLPGGGSSSPIVFKDHIYLTAYTGYGLDSDDPGNRVDLKLHVLCLDRATGKIRWNKSIDASQNEQKASRRVVDHGYATGTPCCDEHGVYAYFGVSGLVAFDHDGNKLWHAETGSKTAGFGSAASPIVHGDNVIINASIESKTVFAFNKKTGKEAWRIADVEKSWTTPIVGMTDKGKPELIVSYKFFVKGHDPATGEELWSCQGIQDYVVPCVVVNEGIAYVLGGRKNQSMAIRLGGSGDVTESHRLWSTNIGANVTSPVYHNGHLYWASDRAILFCLNAKNGDVVYRERLPSRNRVYASTLLVGDRLYHTTRDKGVVVAKAAPAYEKLAHNVIEDEGGMFNASPTAVADQLFFRTNKFLYCISESKSR